jgi:hypothetical protein
MSKFWRADKSDQRASELKEKALHLQKELPKAVSARLEQLEPTEYRALVSEIDRWFAKEKDLEQQLTEINSLAIPWNEQSSPDFETTHTNLTERMEKLTGSLSAYKILNEQVLNPFQRVMVRVYPDGERNAWIRFGNLKRLFEQVELRISATWVLRKSSGTTS